MARSSRRNGAGAAALVALLAPACAGARYELSASSARYPVSLSPALDDPDGHPVTLGAEMQPVGEFSATLLAHGFVYGTTSTTLDISSAVNAQGDRARADGIVGLRVVNRECLRNFL